MSALPTFTIGDDVPVTLKLVNADPTAAAAIGDAVDVVSASVTVYAPDGTASVSAEAMTNEATGFYRYFFSTVGEPEGIYDVEVSYVYNATGGARTRTVKPLGRFKLTGAGDA